MKLEDLKFPVQYNETWKIFDSSKISTFMDCPRKYLLRYLLGWATESENHHIVFGKSWHAAMVKILNREGVHKAYEAFCEVYREHFSEETDMDLYPKNPSNALSALNQYLLHYGSDEFEVIHQEISGSLPIGEFSVKPNDVDLDSPLEIEVELYFRLDNILYDKRLEKYVSLEHKTSERLTQTWLNKWSLAIQPFIYTHVLNSLFSPDKVLGIIINGAFFNKSENRFVRVTVKKTLEQMEEWLVSTHRWTMIILEEMLRLSKQSCSPCACFPKNPGFCFNYNRQCEYYHICCCVTDPFSLVQRYNGQAPPGFKIEFWDPRTGDDQFNVKTSTLLKTLT